MKRMKGLKDELIGELTCILNSIGLHENYKSTFNIVLDYIDEKDERIKR